MSDWSIIRAEYEQGASLRALALKHGVGKSTIAERKFKERWAEHRTDTGRTPDKIPLSRPTPLPIPDDALSIARIGLHQLAQHLQADEILTISSHKSLSDALAQYVKVLVTAPREEAQDGLVLPLEKLLPSTRAAIRRLLAEDEQKQQEERAG